MEIILVEKYEDPNLFLSMGDFFEYGSSNVEVLSGGGSANWAPGYPMIVSPGTTTATMAIKISDQNTSTYFVIVSRGDTAPSRDQVKAGQDGHGVSVSAGFSGGTGPMTVGVAYNLPASNLSPSTNYDTYFVGDIANITVPILKQFSTQSPMVRLSYFNLASAGDNTSVTSTIDSSALVSRVQSVYPGDTYFDTTSEIGPVYVYYTHSAGRQQKRLIHNVINHQASVQWSPYAQDGTWQKTRIKAFDKDGAFVYLDRTSIGTGEDLTHSNGTIYLNT